MGIASNMGVKVVSVIRNGPQYKENAEHLKKHGAFLVVPDDYVKTPKFKELLGDLPKAKLVFDSVGGSDVNELAKCVEDNGKVVSYANLSNNPAVISTNATVFRGISHVGFWLTKWQQTASEQDVQNMHNEIAKLIQSNKLKLYVEKHPFKDFNVALEQARKGHGGRKVLLSM